jgi:hypothetical protein
MQGERRTAGLVVRTSDDNESVSMHGQIKGVPDGRGNEFGSCDGRGTYVYYPCTQFNSLN